MVFACRRFASRLGLEVEHVFAEVVQLRFVELCGEDGVGGEFEKLECGAYARHNGVRLNAHGDNLLERLVILRNLLGDFMMVQKVLVNVTFLREDLFEHVRDMVRADNTAIAPDLDDVREVDHPSIFLISLIDDVDPLDERAQNCDIDGFAQVFEQGFLLFSRAGPFREGKVAVKCCFDLFTVPTEGGSDADVVYHWQNLRCFDN